MDRVSLLVPLPPVLVCLSVRFFCVPPNMQKLAELQRSLEHLEKPQLIALILKLAAGTDKNYAVIASAVTSAGHANETVAWRGMHTFFFYHFTPPPRAVLPGGFLSGWSILSCGGGLRPPKKLMYLKIGLHFPALVIKCIFRLRNVFLIWWVGGLAKCRDTCITQQSPGASFRTMALVECSDPNQGWEAPMQRNIARTVTR